MENPSQTKMRHNPENAQVITKQNTAGPASEHFTTQTDYLGPGDWQEELYQMIKRLRNQYLPELSDLYNKLSMKLQHIDNHMPAQKLTENYEKVKNFKLMLERTMQFVQIDKSCVKLAHKDKIPVYEKQIVAIINSQKRKPVQTIQQSAGQSPSCSTSRFSVDSTSQTDSSGAADWQEELYQMTDCLQKITLKALSMDSLGQIDTQQNSQNAQAVENQKLCGLVSQDSTTQSDYNGAGDWQEEIYQMIQNMKNQYLPELSDLCNKISMKLQYIDSHMPSQKVTEQYNKMTNFKLMLDRTLLFLNINKSCIQLGLKDKVPAYERQIVHIMNSQKRNPVQTSDQSSGQTSSCNTSRIPVHSAAQTGYPGAGDLPEKLDQINETLKNQYLAGLSDLYEISTKLHADSPMASQKPRDQCQEMKSFKLLLEHSSQSLQIGKGSVQPALEESIPMYKRKIITVLNSEDWKSKQSSGQAPSTGSSGEAGIASGNLSPVRRNLKRLRPCPNDDAHI